MATKYGYQFRQDYPNGYSKNGCVYDGNGNEVGYVDGDGDYRIHKDDTNRGTLYKNS